MDATLKEILEKLDNAYTDNKGVVLGDVVFDPDEVKLLSSNLECLKHEIMKHIQENTFDKLKEDTIKSLYAAKVFLKLINLLNHSR